ncbi:Cyclin-dependent kinase [Fasciola gigantica]|uniref:Cyclin-dependent kinase n=1 Tax=Fasciola gigantica TaxID=46835 RepID=A0A504YA11_FASGI|nr:Cyclin-dependent kinase [Fasciola gigantica]
MVVECYSEFTIQEPANGELTIETFTKDYEYQPVPQGTEFTYSGGHGLPPLQYRWERKKAAPYPHDSSTEDLASLLPGNEGGWDGPKQPFSDSPTNSLEIHGARLRVPENSKYRGMTYAYTCIGSNEVQGRVHEIRKSIIFSVMICPTKRVKMDLSILLSRHLMSSCEISGAPDPDIQFYGYYFLTFIRQLILGLPYGRRFTRFNILMDDIFDSHDQLDPQIKSIWFEENLSRSELVKRLYSRKVKPVTLDSGCDAWTVPLQSIVRALMKKRPAKTKRRHLILLALDKFVNVDNLDEVKRDVRILETRGVELFCR